MKSWRNLGEILHVLYDHGEGWHIGSISPSMISLISIILSEHTSKFMYLRILKHLGTFWNSQIENQGQPLSQGKPVSREMVNKFQNVPKYSRTHFTHVYSKANWYISFSFVNTDMCPPTFDINCRCANPDNDCCNHHYAHVWKLYLCEQWNVLHFKFDL